MSELIVNNAFFIGWVFIIICMLIITYGYLFKKPIPNKTTILKCILSMIVVIIVFILGPVFVILIGHLCIICIFLIICWMIFTFCIGFFNT